MKKIYLLLLMTMSFIVLRGQNGRFLSSVFDDIKITSEIEFSRAVRVSETEPVPLYLNFYEPDGDTMQHRPLVIMIFGGAFVAGSRNFVDMVTYAEALSHHGYIAASIDYRLLALMNFSSPNFVRAGYAAAQDVSSAVRFFKANYDLYGVDTTQIFLLGNSAGSIAALYEIYLDENERPAETYNDYDLGELHSSGFDYYRNNTPTVAGVISQWGGVTDLEIVDEDEKTPVCFIHGTSDNVIPYDSGYCVFMGASLMYLYGSHTISQRLDNFVVTNELHPFEGEGHNFYFNNSYNLVQNKFDSCFYITRDFLAKYNNYLGGLQSYTSGNSFITVYPNPADNYINIKTCNGKAIESKITIYSSFGNVVKELYVNADVPNVYVGDLAQGFYVITLNISDKTVYGKFIKGL
ncbi:MAG: carboxylesterase family protein [Bacteroidales bacterium]|jgi:acetyl esterase/lipase|nr:carboxylesterase family protein [Bacteroidales bacterium]MDD2205132.1 carboxylesterase family protein [Bacteroidales bacterium]MDD3151484.1 carboxylesterase family protein [Bacteroidales bacterium]MDD3914897.1 carboxylesterase family protein [Bacteroidales bacterium]MDD4634682.1 carboxylesterase family protein [Bacteroidales bacterium]